MNFTITQQEVLVGALLGDGCLELGRKSKNACFKYNSSCKEHVEFVHSFFKNYCTDTYQNVKRYTYFDKRTNKSYTTYVFRTRCLPEFTKEHTKWYVDSVKIVPKNLVKTKLTWLVWYLGDGQLDSQAGYITLHTNSFTFSEVAQLCTLVGEYTYVRTKMGKTKYQPLLILPRRHVSEFLTYIGKCPVNCYTHKWNMLPYKNKKIEKNGFIYYGKILPDILEEYQQHTIKPALYSLSKKYNVPVGSIKHFFKQQKQIITKYPRTKPILQYTIDGQFIREWESGQAIVKTLGHNASAISECCRGKRKHYKKFVWKFKTQLKNN